MTPAPLPFLRDRQGRFFALKGMTTRAITPVVGAGYRTVQRDIESSGSNDPDAPRTKTGLDGITALLARAAHRHAREPII